MLNAPVPTNIHTSLTDILSSFLSKTARITRTQAAVTEHLTSAISIGLRPASAKERVNNPIMPQSEAATTTHRAAMPLSFMRKAVSGGPCSCRRKGSRI